MTSSITQSSFDTSRLETNSVTIKRKDKINYSHINENVLPFSFFFFFFGTYNSLSSNWNQTKHRGPKKKNVWYHLGIL